MWLEDGFTCETLGEECELPVPGNGGRRYTGVTPARGARSGSDSVHLLTESGSDEILRFREKFQALVTR